MHLIKTISTKTLGQARVGELVKITVDGGWHFAILLDGNEKRAMVGVLDPTAKSHTPKYHRLACREKCVSYGSEWAVEPIIDQEFIPGNSKHQASSGALFIAQSDALVCFQPAEQESNSTEVYFNLTKNSLEDSYPLVLGAPILKWRIWESNEEYQRTGAKPLLEVNAA
jgi:hypothetical protein